MRGTITNFVGVTNNTRQLMHIDERLHIAKVGLNYNFGPHRQPDIAPVRTSRSYDWTGFYIGGEGADGRQPVRWIGFAPFDHYTATGSLGGVVAGARVQPSLFVAGVEAEWMGGTLTGGRSDVTFVSPFLTGTQTLASRFDQIAMATAQVGLPVLDRLLVYGKAGMALAHGTHTDNDFILGSPAVTNSIFLNQGGVWHTGAVLGAGAEYAFFGNWSAKLEYNWIHFYDQQVYLPGTFTEILPARGTETGTLPTSATLGTSLQLVKLGINYRFGPDVVRAKF
jgi:outer membrane immunogenic protein